MDKKQQQPKKPTNPGQKIPSKEAPQQQPGKNAPQQKKPTSNW